MHRIAKFMPVVTGYRERLASLQGAWDSLALLSHLSQDGTDLSVTRQAFEALTGELISHLTVETHRKTLLAARARAQVAIDTLVRNLFERTADIGFLAQDAALCRFAQEVAQEAAQDTSARTLQRRLAQYVAQYSVYDNVVLVAPTGEVLLQLDQGRAPARTCDPLVAATLSTDRPFVETFGASDLCPGQGRALIYSHRIRDEHQTLGVLCLSFRLEDECQRIFSTLCARDDWMIVTLLDQDDAVIASSDAWQVPVGARITTADPERGGIIRFAGREYLAITRPAQSFQGYAGPGWRGHVMVPLERAFEGGSQAARFGVTSALLSQLRESSEHFSPELRAIPQQADAVQRDLNRSVWNGSVRMAADDAGNATFAKALLREISNLGRKTKDVFGQSIEDLQETVVSAVLQDSQFMASLGAELLARNLYERANDCRWWALDQTLCGCLAGDPACGGDAAAAVLRHINSLYTVYHAIVLLDADRRVIAGSRPDQDGLLGSTINETWATQVLRLAGAQAFCVSEFENSVFYAGRPTLTFAAPIRGEGGRVLGAVAVVFDAAPQLSAMLRDCLPRDQSGAPLSGCVSLFLDQAGRPLASSAALPGDDLDLGWVRETGPQGAARVVRAGERYFAVGVMPDPGYREFKGLAGCSVMLMPIGRAAARTTSTRHELPPRSASRHLDGTVREFATFASGSNWYALPTSQVLEAVDAGTLQRLPGGRDGCRGYLMFHGEPLSVIDLAQVLGDAELETPRLVVVVQPQGRPQRLGLLVELLGDVAEVPAGRLKPVAHGQAPLTPLAIESPEAEVAPVMVLNCEALAQQLFGPPPAAQSAA